MGKGPLSVGAGPYALLGMGRNEARQDKDSDRLAGIATLTMAYAIGPALRVRWFDEWLSVWRRALGAVRVLLGDLSGTLAA